MRYSPGKPPQEVAIATTFKAKNRSAYGQEEIALENTSLARDNAKTLSEYSILSQLKGKEGVIQVHDHFTADIGGLNAAFVVMDCYTSGNLHKFQKTEKFKNLSREQKKHLIFSLVRAFASIHHEGVMHRDVRPENILIKETENGLFEAVLIDFEFSSTPDDYDLNKERAGTLIYYAPEYAQALSTNKPDAIAQATTPGIDVWALGQICYKLWFGNELLEDVTLPKKEEEVGQQKKTEEEIKLEQKQGLTDRSIDEAMKKHPDLYDHPISNLIQEMLHTNPDERSSCKSLEDIMMLFGD